MSPKLSTAQLGTLRRVAKRDYTAGEPRFDWFRTDTMTNLKRRGLIVERAASANPETWVTRAPIVDLTPAGLAALAAAPATRGKEPS